MPRAAVMFSIPEIRVLLVMDDDEERSKRTSSSISFSLLRSDSWREIQFCSTRLHSHALQETALERWMQSPQNYWEA